MRKFIEYQPAINLQWGHACHSSYHSKSGPDRFNPYDVYGIQTNKQQKTSKKQAKYINKIDNSGDLLTNFGFCLKSNKFVLYYFEMFYFF